MSDEAMKKVSKSPELRRSRIRCPARRLARDEGGAVAVMFALMLGALIGVMALAVDLGKAWNLQTELQHAADACALAGATQLDGTDGARARAIDACINKVALPLVENTQRFASDGLGVDVTFDTNTEIDTSGGAGDGKTLNTDIKFYSSLPISAAVEATSDTEASFIEANVAPRRVDFSFAAVVGAVNSVSPSARAVAGWTSFFCDSPPMFMCNPAEPVGGDKSAPFYIDSSCADDGSGRSDATSCVGRTLAMKTHAGGGNQQLGPGDWGYLSLEVFDPDTGETTTLSGAAQLGDALASVEYDNVCVGNQLSTKPGNMTSLDRKINTRFDIYFKDTEMFDQNRQPARQSLKGLIPNPDDGSWDPNTDGCGFNPATMADTGGAWWRPQDQYGVDPVTGQPTLGPDGFPDRYLGPGRHRKVDVLDNTTMTAGTDGMPDPHPLNEGANDPPALGLVDPPIRTMAFPNDFCAYLASEVDASVGTVIKGVEGCRPSEGGLHMGSGQWDRQTYLDVYHPDLEVSDLLCPGDFGDPNTTCADLPNVPGATPDGKLSRWELYKWESKTEVVGAITEYPNIPQKGKPRCYKAPEEMGDEYLLPESPATSGTVDRRIIVMAVVNCVGWEVKGKSTMDRAPGDSHIAIFLTEPMGLTEKDSLSGEVVDPKGLGIGEIEVQPQLVRERILLIE